MLKKLLRHIITSGSFQRQYSIIAPTSPPKGKLVSLRENLAVELSNQVRTSSYQHLKKDDRKYEIARAVFTISLLLALIFFFITLYALFMSASAEFFKLTWLKILIMSLCFAVATFWGQTTLSKLSRNTYDPLHSNGQDIFIKAEMNEKWTSFREWAHDYKPNIWIEQKDGPAKLLAEGFWDLDNVDLFILGDKSHHNLLLIDSRKLTSGLMVSEHDWKVFEKLHHTQQSQREKRTIPAEKTAPKSVSTLTAVQRKHGLASKKSPRFTLLVENQEFDERYLLANVNVSRRTKADNACHNALMLIMENRELFKKLVSNNGLARTEEQIQFKAELKQALRDQKNPYLQIVKFRWLKMESYLTGLGIISEDELKLHNVKI